MSELNHPKVMRTNVIGFVLDSSSPARTLHQLFRGPHHRQVLTCPVVPKTSTRRFQTVCERVMGLRLAAIRSRGVDSNRGDVTFLRAPSFRPCKHR